MSENLVERLARILKSDLSDFLDIEGQPEDRDEQNLSDVLSELKSELGEKLAVAHRQSKMLSELSSEHSAVAEKAEFAIWKGRDDLARAALARKFDLSKKISDLGDELDDLDAETKQLEAAIETITARLNGTAPDALGPLTADILKELDTLFASEQTESKKTYRHGYLQPCPHAVHHRHYGHAGHHGR